MQNVFLNTMRHNVASLKAAEELELALISQKGFLSNYFLDKDPVWLERLEEKRANFSEWLKKAMDAAVTSEEKNIISDINRLYARYENDRLNAKKLYESGRTQEAKILLLGDMWETLEILYQKCEEYISINESIITKSEGALRRKIAGMMFLIVIPSIVGSLSQSA